MIEDPEEVIASVQDAIGLDAYHIYPDSRKLIPDAVLWGFASACVLEFVKPLIDFKGLGEGVRAKVEGLLKRWRNKSDLEAYVKAEEVKQAVVMTIQAYPGVITPVQQQNAVGRVADALTAMGLPSDTALNHAQQIAQLVGGTVSKS